MSCTYPPQTNPPSAPPTQQPPSLEQKKNEPFLHRNHSKTFPPQLLNPRPLRPNLPHTNQSLLKLRPLLKNPLPNHPRQGALKYLQCLPHIRRRQRPRTLLLLLLWVRSPHSSNKRYNLRLSKRNTSLQRHTPARPNGKGCPSGSNELHRRRPEFWIGS